MSGMLGVECIYQLLPPGQNVSVNGDSGMIDVTDWDNFTVMSTVGANAGGSSPVLAIHLDGFDPWGNTYADLCSPNAILSFSGAGNQNASVGIDAQFVAQTAPGVPGSNNLLFCAPQKIRLRWTLTGGGTWSGFYLSLYARD